MPRRALGASPEFRREVDEHSFAGVSPAIREQLVFAFVYRLERAPRPPAALMPTVIDTCPA